jgi:thymidine kinase
MNKLKFYYGTMNSCKTSELLMFAHSLKSKGFNYLIFKPDIDTRTPLNVVESRIDGMSASAFTLYYTTNIYDSVMEIIQKLDSDDILNYILIDEAQFLTPRQVEELVKIVDELNINVFCYGLKDDFTTRMFDGSKRLFELSDELEEITTICSCGRKANFNARINNLGIIEKTGNQIEIGDEDKYITLCRKCYGEII